MKILIAGGSGLVGTRLTEILHNQDHEVRHLSRKKYDHPLAEVFTWYLGNQWIESGALDGVDVVINLAGAGVADQKWTKKRKKMLYDSRIDAVKCLYANIKNTDSRPELVITASGKDYYGEHPFDTVSHEEDKYGDTFLAQLCKAWEDEAKKYESMGIRTAQLRIGMVLDAKGGALPKLAQPIRFGAGAALGSGQQVIPWIHIDDICGMIIQIVNEKKAFGPYNIVSGNCTNKAFNKVLAKILKRPLILPNVPAFVLKLMLGEMAAIVLTGNHAANQKILDLGYQLKYGTLEKALNDIYTDH